MTQYEQLSLLVPSRNLFLLDALVPTSGEPMFRRGRLESGRTIYIANPAMESLQARLLSWLRSMRTWMPHAHGGVQGRSPATNARAHRGNRYFYMTDLRSAFETVTADRMTEVLRNNSSHLRGFPPEMTRDWLERYCFLPDGGLYTGGAASPMLFNLYVTAMLSRTLVHLGTYTHYLDDIVVSTPHYPLSIADRRALREAVWRAGFELVDHKTRTKLDIHKGPIEITGVMLDRDGRTFPSKRRRTRASGLLASALSGKVDPDVALGHVGACLAPLGDPVGQFIRPEVGRLMDGRDKLVAVHSHRSDR